MNTFSERLNKLSEKVSHLIGDHQRLQQQLVEQENAARQHQRSSDVLKARVNELERENELLRNAAPAAQSGSDAPGSKERIDELVAEIDRCLELLRPIER